jgi:GNAT superfamily N-acetyltransferase
MDETITYAWRGTVGNAELEALHAEGFDRAPDPANDWTGQLERHSLGWATARAGTELVGFVNVAWDGGSHAFVLDTLTAPPWRRRGIGAALVARAAEHAAAAGCEWLHVDFEDHLKRFYFDACGFRPTDAGLIAL